MVAWPGETEERQLGALSAQDILAITEKVPEAVRHISTSALIKEGTQTEGSSYKSIPPEEQEKKGSPGSSITSYVSLVSNLKKEQNEDDIIAITRDKSSETQITQPSTSKHIPKQTEAESATVLGERDEKRVQFTGVRASVTEENLQKNKKRTSKDTRVATKKEKKKESEEDLTDK